MSETDTKGPSSLGESGRVQSCVCGEPSSGVVHRTDGPCYIMRTGDWRSYLPMDCPKCARHRLEYRVNVQGNVIEIECEKCGWNSDDDPATSGS